MGKKRTKKKWHVLLIEFIKLQLSGNVLFWGTMAGLFVLHELFHWQQIVALATASVLAHILFFVINKEWVFDDKTGKRKTSHEVTRFVLFMGFNYFLNLGIVSGLAHYFDVSPYIGQLVSAIFFTAWTFIGMKYWVFQDAKHHSLRTSYVKKKGVRYRARRTVRKIRTA